MIPAPFWPTISNDFAIYPQSVVRNLLSTLLSDFTLGGWVGGTNLDSFGRFHPLFDLAEVGGTTKDQLFWCTEAFVRLWFGDDQVPDVPSASFLLGADYVRQTKGHRRWLFRALRLSSTEMSKGKRIKIVCQLLQNYSRRLQRLNRLIERIVLGYQLVLNKIIIWMLVRNN